MKFEHVLIAIDGSEPAAKALAQGLALARQLRARVTVVTVSELWSPLDMAHLSVQGELKPVELYERHAKAQADSVLSQAKAAAGPDISVDTVHVKDQHPAEGVTQTARERNCDVIVVGTHGRRGVDRILLGSQASRIIAMAKVPVLVCQ